MILHCKPTGDFKTVGLYTNPSDIYTSLDPMFWTKIEELNTTISRRYDFTYRYEFNEQPSNYTNRKIVFCGVRSEYETKVQIYDFLSK